MIWKSGLAAPLLALALVSASGCQAKSNATADHAAHARLVALDIHTASGRTVDFRVEVARTPGEQERGLMFRKSLPANGGMIFPMQPARPTSFWMKNTLIPLDMLFIRSDGTIARIAENTEPLSLQPVDSGEPVAAVLEIAGGRARALGIAEGNRVRWPR